MFWLYIIIFIFGLCLGSFLNVVICRLEKGKGFVKGRSACPKCKHLLAWQDLIPVYSFIALRGRCRYCKNKISFQYPLVELATGLILLLNYSFFASNSLLFIVYCFISALLIIIFVYDLKTMYIQSNVVYIGIGVVVLYLLINWDWRLFVNHLLAGFGFALFLFLFWALSRGKAMGLGDAELGFLIGFFLGWPSVLMAALFGFILGGVFAVFLLVFKKKTLKSAVPLGPFLITGFFISLYLSRNLDIFKFLSFPLWY